MSTNNTRPKPLIGGVIFGLLALAIGISFVVLRATLFRQMVWVMDNFIWPNQVEIRTHATSYDLMPHVATMGILTGVALVLTSYLAPRVVTDLIGAVRYGIDALVSTVTPRDESGRRRLKVAAVLSPALTLILAASILLLRETPGLLRERGPTESVTALAYLLASGLLVTAAYKRRGSIHRLGLAAYLFLAVTAFVVGMEEIAWGQHILGFEPPERIAEINDHDELSAHNIIEWEQYFEMAAAIWSAGGICLGLIAILLDYAGRSSPALNRVLPPPWLLPPLMIIFIYFAFDYRTNKLLDTWHHPVVPETREMMLGLCIFLYAVWVLRPFGRDDTLSTLPRPDIAQS